MNNILLSILIPTVVGREDAFRFLQRRLDLQKHKYTGYDGSIEVLALKDNKELSIGEKRESLYKSASGLYGWQIDDDDNIADDAIELILQAIKENPDVDCVTFDEYCLMNGVEYNSRHSLLYDDWEGDGNTLFPEGVHFRRTPFYKDVIKTGIARSVPFPKIRWGEDHEWAKALKPHLKTEYHIPKQLYRYIHNSKPEEHNERYGLDKS